MHGVIQVLNTYSKSGSDGVLMYTPRQKWDMEDVHIPRAIMQMEMRSILP